MSQIPFSNPAGNNQTSPGASQGMLGKGSISVGKPIPGTGMGTVPVDNPYVPPILGTRPMGSGAPVAHPLSQGNVPLNSVGGPGQPTSSQSGFITPNSTPSGQNNLEKQLIDIYGKGVGGSLFSLLDSMSGTNSQVLQDYIKSLQPQEAAAEANIGASLGAGGVSANSGVNAIAQANLQSQEFSAIAGESAKLTMNQEELTAHLLSGMEGAASKEVATSAWTTFADVMNNITGDVGNLVGGDYQTKAGQGYGGTTPDTSINNSIPSGGGDGGTGW